MHSDGTHQLSLKPTNWADGSTDWALTCFDCKKSFRILKGDSGKDALLLSQSAHEKRTAAEAAEKRRLGK